MEVKKNLEIEKVNRNFKAQPIPNYNEMVLIQMIYEKFNSINKFFIFNRKMNISIQTLQHQKSQNQLQ